MDLVKKKHKALYLKENFGTKLSKIRKSETTDQKDKGVI